jgi:hypothetical protein
LLPSEQVSALTHYIVWREVHEVNREKMAMQESLGRGIFELSVADAWTS